VLKLSQLIKRQSTRLKVENILKFELIEMNQRDKIFIEILINYDLRLNG